MKIKRNDLDKIVLIAREITEKYEDILELIPNDNDKDPLLKEFASSCILFTSFISHLIESETKSEH